MYNIGMSLSNNKRGFTIIEVVLVLAIAGLIFLMVFIALPALQRSQRNSQRQNDVNRVATALVEYQKHNSGKLPIRKEGASFVFDKKFVRRYIDSSCSEGVVVPAQGISKEVPSGGIYKFTDCGQQFTDPDGTIYYFAFMNGADYGTYKSNGDVRTNINLDFDHVMYVGQNTKCGAGENELIFGNSSNTFAILMVMEGGAYYCRDNAQ